MRINVDCLRRLVALPPSLSIQEIAQRLTLAGLETEVDQEKILDVAVTPNRPDALSHLGIARELSAVLQVPLLGNKPRCQEMQASVDTVAHVTIAHRRACPRFACRVVDGVSVGESPAWLRERLESCGLRPVNNVVDITNWVMLHRGHPLHAYDRDRLARQRERASLIVRPARQGEVLETLDGCTRELSDQDLVVADPQGPLALAGVMGGKRGEVTNQTQSVLLEAAYFTPQVVRGMVQRHRLTTQAGYRMERGCDPAAVVDALDEAARLMQEVASGRAYKGIIDVYPDRIKPAVVAFRPSRFYEISGFSERGVDQRCLLRLFGSLGIETIGRPGNDAVCFSIPTFRPDLTREIDLIEEAMRLLGIDRVPQAPLVVAPRQIVPLQETNTSTLRRIRKALVGQGFCEALTLSLGCLSQHEPFAAAKGIQTAQLHNPLTEEMNVLRTSLLPGLLAAAARNVRHGTATVRLFEIGTVFAAREQPDIPPGTMPGLEARQADETLLLGGVMTGTNGDEGFDREPKPLDFYDAKGVMQELLACLGIDQSLANCPLQFVPLPQSHHHLLHPGRSAALSLCHPERSEGSPHLSKHEEILPRCARQDDKQSVIGTLGQLHPKLAQEYDLPTCPYVFELDVKTLRVMMKQATVHIDPPPRYPAVQRDLAVVVAESVTADRVIDTIRSHKQARAWVEDIRFFDLYRGPSIGQGKKSMGLSLILRAADRTLTDDEVAVLMQEILAKLQTELDAAIRS
ncbi:MAG: phenylalanine--tRNA ligase subunit beta [Myxococcota bacterium]